MDPNRPITTDLRHLNLTANKITAKLTNQCIQTGLSTFDWQQPFHLTLMMTSAQVVETSVTTTDNSPCQDNTHPDDHTITCYPRVGSRVQTIYWKHLLWRGKNISVPTLIFCFNWMWYQRPFLSQVWLFCDLSLWSWPAIMPSFFVQFSSAIFFEVDVNASRHEIYPQSSIKILALVKKKKDKETHHKLGEPDLVFSV